MRQNDSIRQNISFGRCGDFVEVGKRRARASGGDALPLAQSACRTTMSMRGLRGIDG